VAWHVVLLQSVVLLRSSDAATATAPKSRKARRAGSGGTGSKPTGYTGSQVMVVRIEWIGCTGAASGVTV